MKKLIFIILALSISSFAQNWERIDSIFNPSGVTVQNFSAPFFCDIDKDGDFDLFLGNIGNRVDFFRNIGPQLNPKFFSDTSLLSSIYSSGSGGTNSYYPVLVDLDNDGDDDLIIDGFNGLLLYWNTGDGLNPIWVKDTIVFSQINAMIGQDPKPAFADLDADGDFDLLVGIGESILGGPTPGITIGFRNTGSATNPVFSYYLPFVTGIADIGRNSYPALADLDNDGDFDLLLGRDLQTFVYYINTGTPQTPQWTQNTTLFAGVESSTYWKNPTFCDLDGDGDYDLIYGQSSGRLYFYKNTGTPSNPSFQYDPSYFVVVKLDGNSSTCSLADFDNDGDFDLLSGIWTGTFQFFRNVGSKNFPSFQKASASFTNINPGSYSSPVFVDLDKDGDYDIVSGALNGRIYCYINNNGNFVQNTSIFGNINVGGFSIPAFADIDNDGDEDLLVGSEQSSNVKFFRNSGNNVFVEDSSVISNIAFPNYSRPTFSDVDNDGDFDLVIGKSDGTIVYFENKGNPLVPNFVRNDTLFAGVRTKQNAHPGFADLDGDGRKDLVLGEYDGNFTFFKNLFAVPLSVENVLSRISDFNLYQNYPNPFNSKTKIRFTVASTDLNSTKGEIITTLKVYDLLGRKIATLVNEPKQAGEYEVEFDADKYGLTSGVYLYELRSGSFKLVKKFVLMK